MCCIVLQIQDEVQGRASFPLEEFDYYNTSAVAIATTVTNHMFGGSDGFWQRFWSNSEKAATAETLLKIMKVSSWQCRHTTVSVLLCCGVGASLNGYVAASQLLALMHGTDAHSTTCQSGSLVWVRDTPARICTCACVDTAPLHPVSPHQLAIR